MICIKEITPCSKKLTNITLFFSQFAGLLALLLKVTNTFLFLPTPGRTSGSVGDHTLYPLFIPELCTYLKMSTILENFCRIAKASTPSYFDRYSRFCNPCKIILFYK
jgi:hypothetical protein